MAPFQKIFVQTFIRIVRFYAFMGHTRGRKVIRDFCTPPNCVVLAFNCSGEGCIYPSLPSFGCTVLTGVCRCPPLISDFFVPKRIPHSKRCCWKVSRFPTRPPGRPAFIAEIILRVHVIPSSASYSARPTIDQYDEQTPLALT